MKSFVIKPLSIALLAATLAACSTNAPAPSASAAKAAEAALNNDDWYQVWTEGQAVVFDDHAVYAEYVKTGKAPVMKDLGIKAKSYTGWQVPIRTDSAFSKSA